MLRGDRVLHPLLERIMRIHVTEEARHLSFARHYLKRRVPHLGPLRRFGLVIGAPVVLSQMARLMLTPPRQMIQTYGIPKEVVREAYGRGSVTETNADESLAKVRRLCREIGLLDGRFAPALWRSLGLNPAG
jgi:hypothetical protein